MIDSMADRPIVIEQIEDELAAILRRKTPTQRLTASFDMWRFARDRLNAPISDEHPEWTALERRNEFRRRMLGSS